MSDAVACSHIEAIEAVKHAKKHVCDECVKIGGHWVHLRTCQDLRRNALLRQLAEQARHQTCEGRRPIR